MLAIIVIDYSCCILTLCNHTHLDTLVITEKYYVFPLTQRLRKLLTCWSNGPSTSCKRKCILFCSIHNYFYSSIQYHSPSRVEITFPRCWGEFTCVHI